MKTRNINKDDIIAAAERLLNKGGVNSFSLKDLSKEADIAPGTLYYHFPTKNDLILALMEKHMGELQSDYAAWLERHSDGTLTPERFLSVIFYKGVKLFNKAKLHLYLINECLSGAPELKDRYVALWNAWKKEIAAGLKEAMPHLRNPEEAAYLLMLLLDGLTVQEALGGNGMSEERLSKVIAASLEETKA